MFHKWQGVKDTKNTRVLAMIIISVFTHPVIRVIRSDRVLILQLRSYDFIAVIYLQYIIEAFWKAFAPGLKMVREACAS